MKLKSMLTMRSRMESGDQMSFDDNMTKIMNVVRHFTGDTDKLSFDDAIDSLLKLKANKLVPEGVDWNKINDFNMADCKI